MAYPRPITNYYTMFENDDNINMVKVLCIFFSNYWLLLIVLNFNNTTLYKSNVRSRCAPLVFCLSKQPTTTMAARLRSKSESLSTPPHNITSSRHNSVTEDDYIDVTFISPLARQRQNITGADANSISAEPVSSKSKKCPALKRWPCGSSSACEQMWHRVCQK